MKKYINILVFLLLQNQLFAQVCTGEVLNITNPNPNSNGIISSWIVPSGGPYKIRITAKGGKGGDSNNGFVGGKGRVMIGEFIVSSGQILDINAGSMGGSSTLGGFLLGGGGGGSGVKIGTSYLIVGGGGGGASPAQNGGDANQSTGGSGAYSPGGQNGTGGGGAMDNGGGGGGGISDTGGAGANDSFFGGNSGFNALISGNGGGGIGGGGGASGYSMYGGGGGGGYSGGSSGGGFTSGATNIGGAGGAGSYNLGANQVNTGLTNGGGQVIIQCLGSATISATLTATQPTNAVPTEGSVSIDLTGDLNGYISGGVEYAIVSGSNFTGTPPFTDITAEPFNISSGTGTAATISGSSYTMRIRLKSNPSIFIDKTYTLTSPITRLYVNATATGANNGITWTEAFTDLQSALTFARSNASVTEILVAAGTYKPTTGTDRAISFSMINDVAIYGGFPNTGNPTMTERNWTTNPTILSGDLNGNDVITGSGATLSITNNGENSYHVIFNNYSQNNPLTATAVLDGFTITGGKSVSFPNVEGGGMLNKFSNPSLRNLTFSGNNATNGGGMLNNRSSPNQNNITYINNYAEIGGGMYNYNSSPLIKNSTFVGNTSSISYSNSGGGGMYNTISSPILTNVVFTDNFAAINGGGIYNYLQCNVISNNVTFHNNRASTGGAVYIEATTLTFTNCIFSENKQGGNVAVFGADISVSIGNANFPSIADIKNTLLQLPKNNYPISGNNKFQFSDVNNIAFDKDPQFVNSADPDGADNIFGTSDDGFMLSSCSPAINAGDNTGISGVDLANNQRIYNNGVVDMGAYEYQGAAITAPTGVSINSPMVCQGTNVTLSATCAGGVVTWYNTATGGVAIGTGSPFNYTPPVGNNQTFYASCLGTCETARVVTGTQITVPPTRIYVNALATGVNNGSSWANAYTNILDAVLQVTPFCPAEIWVAKGTYLTPNNIRVMSYLINTNLSIYGGFDGTETLLVQRNWKNNPTILSGELGNPNDNTDNAQHIFTIMFGVSNAVTIDGFTLTKTYSEMGQGGAISAIGLTNTSTLNISNCIFKENYATMGGALFLNGPPPAPVGFPQNKLNANFTNCLFLKNHTIQTPNFSFGGAIYQTIGVNAIITNCTFTENSALTAGGAIYSLDTASKTTLRNSIFWGNTAPQGSQIALVSAKATISNSILQNGVGGVYLTTSTFPNSTLGVVTDGGNLLNLNPLFNNSASEDYTLNPCSPGVNSGDNASNTSIFDIDGNPRVFNITIDMGAYETQTTKPSAPTITPPKLVVCSPTTLTLTANCATGNVVWSDNSTGTSLTLSAVGTHAISAKCTLNGCDSDASSTTNLEIKAKPAAPTIIPPSQLVVCSPTTLTLTANCTTGTVLWSDNSTGTSLTLSAVGTYAISAKCTLNGCDSDASSTTNLEIKAKPSIPTITPPSQLVVCSPTTLTLTANCATGTVLWSDNSTGTSLTLSSVGTYAVSAKCQSNGCDSDASSTTNLEIKAKPSTPTITLPSQLVVCSPTTLTLTASCASGNVVWSDNSTGTSFTLSVVGNYDISAKCQSNGCESDASSTINLEIKAKPSVPAITLPSQLVVCSPTTLTLTANCATGNVVWADNSTGSSLTLSAVGTYAISAKCTQNSCDSDASSITNLEIKSLPIAQASNSGPYQVGNTISLSASGGSGTPPDLHVWSGPNNFSSTLQNPSILAAQTINGGVYTVTVMSGICSATATTNVVVNGLEPCSVGVEYQFVKAGNPYKPLFVLTNGMNINQLTDAVSILAVPVCVTQAIESIEMRLQGPSINHRTVQNISPYALFNNTNVLVHGRVLLPGTYTLTVSAYSQDNLQGTLLFGPSQITFTVLANTATISQPSLSRTSLCSGSSFEVNFTSTGAFNSNNQFKVELSDANGSFESIVNIGNTSNIGGFIQPIVVGLSNSSGTITCTIPSSVEGGTNYRVRVISTDGVSSSTVSLPFTIHPKNLVFVSPTNDIITNVGTKQASQTITATNKVNSPAKVNYQAGKSILFTPGFEANAGTVFKAEIMGCN